MGKTNNLFTGIVRKKVGSLVGYRITNSNNGEKQGLRTYVANPKNPKTLAQAIQRCKLGPASRFYRAFSDILDHAFEGVAVGTPSRSHFMSLAMLSGTPASPKGDTDIPVFPYIVTEGSMPVSLFPSILGSNLEVKGLKVGNAAQLPETIGEFAQQIIENTPSIQEGDEITFVALVAPSLGDLIGARIPVHMSIVLDTTDTSSMSDWNSSPFVQIAPSLGFIELRPSGADYKMLAATCVMSRRIGASWVYTPASMLVTAQGAAVYNDSKVEEAVRSYMDKNTYATSDLILQQANNGLEVQP